MTHVLVTGGAGYIGSVLVGLLLNAGYKVTVVDSFLYGETSLLAYMTNPYFSCLRGDVRHLELMEPLIKEVDIIIPLACLVGAPLCDYDQVGARTTNHDSVEMILSLMRPAQKLLFPTTNSGYGVGLGDDYCTEESPLNPISLYARLKVDIEKKILSSGQGITFRLATVFGVSTRMRMDLLVNDFTYRAVKDRFIVLFEAHFKRNFLHVRDAANVFLHGISNFESMKGQAYNVGLSSANLSKRELCSVISSFIPEFTVLESDIAEDPDKRDYIVSNEKLESTGFCATVSLEEGIKELIKAYHVMSNTKYSNV